MAVLETHGSSVGDDVVAVAPLVVAALNWLLPANQPGMIRSVPYQPLSQWPSPVNRSSGAFPHNPPPCRHYAARMASLTCAACATVVSDDAGAAVVAVLAACKRHAGWVGSAGTGNALAEGVLAKTVLTHGTHGGDDLQAFAVAALASPLYEVRPRARSRACRRCVLGFRLSQRLLPLSFVAPS